MRALTALFSLFLTLHALPISASVFGDGRPSLSGIRHGRWPYLDGCERDLYSNSDLKNISVTDPVVDSNAIAKLLSFKIKSTQRSVFARMAQAAFEISLANSGNVSISELVTDEQADPKILITIDLQPEELNGNYRLQYSSSQEDLKSQIMVPRIEIRIEPERVVIFQARAPGVKVGNTLITAEITSHGNGLTIAYPGSQTPVIEAGIVPSRMVFNSETLFGRHCLEIAKVAGLNMSSSGLVYLRTMDGSYVLSDNGWIPRMSVKSSTRRVISR